MLVQRGWPRSRCASSPVGGGVRAERPAAATRPRRRPSGPRRPPRRRSCSTATWRAPEPAWRAAAGSRARRRVRRAAVQPRSGSPGCTRRSAKYAAPRASTLGRAPPLRPGSRHRRTGGRLCPRHAHRPRTSPWACPGFRAASAVYRAATQKPQAPRRTADRSWSMTGGSLATLGRRPGRTAGRSGRRTTTQLLLGTTGFAPGTYCDRRYAPGARCARCAVRPQPDGRRLARTSSAT